MRYESSRDARWLERVMFTRADLLVFLLYVVGCALAVLPLVLR